MASLSRAFKTVVLHNSQDRRLVGFMTGTCGTLRNTVSLVLSACGDTHLREQDLCFLRTSTLSSLSNMECETVATCMFSDMPIKPTLETQ